MFNMYFYEMNTATCSSDASSAPARSAAQSLNMTICLDTAILLVVSFLRAILAIIGRIIMPKVAKPQYLVPS